MGSVMSPDGQIGPEFVLKFLADQCSDNSLVFLETEGLGGIDQWPENCLSHKIRNVIKNNPIEGLVDMEECPGFRVDRFVIDDGQSDYLVEISKSLLMVQGRCTEFV